MVIEHNLDIIKYADWIIDMGPEGGKQGGEVLFQGIPEDLVNCNNSHTALYLSSVGLPGNDATNESFLPS
jgi:excinuclease ABC subunit A